MRISGFKRVGMTIAFLLTILLARGRAAIAETAPEIEVYKVDRVVTERDHIQTGETVGFEKPFAQIEIAAIELGDRDPDSVDYFAEWEFRQRNDRFWLVGSAGVATDAHLFTRELRCVYLCGDGGGEECRDTGLIDWQGQAIGEPLMAVAGLTGEVTDFVSFLDVESTEEIPELNSDRVELLSPSGISLSVSSQESALRLTGESYWNSIESEPTQCTWTDYGESGLGSLTCQQEAVLFQGGEPLMLSYSDYNVAGATVVNGFTVEGRRYYTAVLGQKGYTAYGLLFETDEGWQVVFSTHDWPTLC